MEKFNVVKNYKNREIVRGFSSVKELTEYIKSDNREEFERIQKARKQGKGKIYDKIKGTIPCIAINFTYNNNYINADNVSEPTGYMYIDIDDVKFDIGDLDIINVVAYWRSLSNQGYTIILKVKGLDANCLKEQYKYVAEKLDIPIDFQAISVDRLTVLSYDSEAYYNPNAKVMILPTCEMPQDSTLKSKKIGYDYNGAELRLNNLEEMVNSLNLNLDLESLANNGIVDLVKVLGHKLQYAEYFLPFRKIKQGEREKILSSCTEQLIALNPKSPKTALKKIVISANKEMSPPLPKEEVDTIFNKKYNKRNILKVKFNKERRYIYTESMTTKEKRRRTMKAINKGRTEKTTQKIRKVIEDWDFKKYKKITQRKVIELSNCAKGTVEKYLNPILVEMMITKEGTPIIK